MSNFLCTGAICTNTTEDFVLPDNEYFHEITPLSSNALLFDGVNNAVYIC